MKKLVNLNGVKALSKQQQQLIRGGSGFGGVCFPTESKCNYFCNSYCTPCGPTSPQGVTPHLCNDIAP